MTTARGDCQSIGDLLGAYALDALDPEETEQVRTHLAGCPRCTQEVEDHRQTIGLLAAGGAGEAPAQVWDAIAATIEGSSPAGHGRRPAMSPMLVNWRHPGRQRWRQPSRLAAAAAAAAAAGFIGVQTAHVDHLDHRVNQLSAAARQSGGFQGVAAALVDPSARHLILTSATSGAKPVGELVILPSGSAYLISSNMAALPATSTYQLWAVIAGRAISVGVLGTHPGAAAFSVDPGVSTTAYLVTVEPAGGVVAPTSSPVAQASA
jgi:hypothetical protein